jgi:hypothetical protein
MKISKIQSACECQAKLEAELDENRLVVRGWARKRGVQETAPAHSMVAEGSRFDVGWLCPFCTRNQLRSFDAGALSYREASSAAQ